MATNNLRLLSLDGGGVRGLSSLYLLKQLLESIADDPRYPPKPCKFFDMICGTSTGGLIAIMLGRLEMTVDECIDAYVAMMDSVFKKKKHRFKNFRGELQARFDTAELESAIKRIVRNSKSAAQLREDLPMRNPDPSGCKTFVCAVAKEQHDLLVKFPSYPRMGEFDSTFYDKVKVWEAARATSAATTFFDEVTIGPNKRVFLDGATGANNPVSELWREAQSIWRGRPLQEQIQCIVSIGTGMPAVQSFRTDTLNIFKVLQTIATETETTARNFAAEHEDLDNRGSYIRLNVQQGLQDVNVEDSESKSTISAMTEQYASGREVRKILHSFREKVRHMESSHPTAHPPTPPLSIGYEESPFGASFSKNVPSSPAAAYPYGSIGRGRGCGLTIAALPVAVPNLRPEGRERSFSFQTLDNSSRFVNPHATNDYWSSVTLDGMNVYEKVYQASRDPRTDLVPFEAFALQFTGTNPNTISSPTLATTSSSASLISSGTYNTIDNFNSTTNFVYQLWRRFDPQHTHHLSHNLSLALTHMIFVELVLGNDPPKHQKQKFSLDQSFEEEDIVVFTPNRRKILECYGNWVLCSCKCGRRWNFANGFEGLRRDEGRVKGCKVEGWMNAGKSKWQPQWSVGKGSAGAELFEMNRVSWLQGRQPTVSKLSV